MPIIGTPDDDILIGTDTTLGLGNDDLILGDDNGQILIGDGGHLDENVYAEGGDDVILGGTARDTLIGDNHTVGSLGGDLEGGDDYLVDGDNVLEGGAGDDTLWGDTERVFTIGGVHERGADEFVFRAGEGGYDTIWDFDDGMDMLVLADFDPGDVSFAATGGDVLVYAGTTQTILVKNQAGMIDFDDIDFV